MSEFFIFIYSFYYAISVLVQRLKILCISSFWVQSGRIKS